MAQLTFPIQGTDLVADARVNLDASTLLAHTATGQPAPHSIPARALIDTGSDVSLVSGWILQQLGAQRLFHRNTQGMGGTVSAGVFRVSISILDASRPPPWFTRPDVWVMELSAGLPFDVIIGMDVLLECRMLVDGPNRTFTIDV